MTLHQKALKCAIKDMNDAPTREDANIVFLKWECFHSNRKFKEAIKAKQKELHKQDVKD